MGKLDNPPKPSVGRPTTFRPEYCDLLIEHMKQGGSIESFASKIPCAIATVYNWFDMFPEFLEARKQGEGFLHGFYENMAKHIATGQLKRIKIEEPVLDNKGKPVYDAKGEVLYRREYESVPGGQAVFIFLTKNMLGWRDRKEITIPMPPSPPVGGTMIDVTPILTPDEVEKRYNELLKKATQQKAK